MLLSPKFDSAEDFMTWARSELFIGLEVPKDWMDYNFAKALYLFAILFCGRYKRAGIPRVARGRL
jgi:hypothetical protein